MQFGSTIAEEFSGVAAPWSHRYQKTAHSHKWQGSGIPSDTAWRYIA
jgi:hypothetical protein